MSTPKAPTLAVLPIDEGRDVGRGPQVLQPGGWPTPKGYANGMAADGRIVVTGGVIGWDSTSGLADDFVAQVRQTLEQHLGHSRRRRGCGPSISSASPGMSSTSRNIWPT